MPPLLKPAICRGRPLRTLGGRLRRVADLRRPFIPTVWARTDAAAAADTEREVYFVLRHRNARRAEQAPINGLIRTRYTLEICVACGHERLRTTRQQTSCPKCGASARRSFALFRGLKEVQR